MPRLARRLAGLMLLLLARPAAAQLPVSAPSGTLTGVVQDSATGRPIGFALITVGGRARSVFATESGRFTISGLSSGVVRLKVQQIGFRAEQRVLRVDTKSDAGPGTPLVIPLVRLALVLPELSVVGSNCFSMRDLATAGVDASPLMEQAYANAERVRALEREFPAILQYQRLVTMLDSGYQDMGGKLDTLKKDSRSYEPYRAGRLLDRPGRVSNFTTSDLAGDEFQKNHCFWYAGRDSLEGFIGYRIEFAPRPDLTTADWAGSLLIDSTSMSLLRTETRLVNIPKGSVFTSAVCTVFYQPIATSLPQEFQLRCVSAVKDTKPRYRVERWLLVNRKFVGKTPLADGSVP